MFTGAVCLPKCGGRRRRARPGRTSRRAEIFGARPSSVTWRTAWLTRRPVGPISEGDLFSTHPKPAGRGSRLDTSFFISHSRFGGSIFSPRAPRRVPPISDRSSSMGRGGRERTGREVERSPQACETAREFRVLCTPKLATTSRTSGRKKRGVRASLSDKSTDKSGFSWPHANGAPWCTATSPLRPVVRESVPARFLIATARSLFPSFHLAPA